MKKRALWAIGISIALLGLLGVLLKFKQAPDLSAAQAIWQGAHEWFSPEPAVIEHIARDLAASGDAKKLAFAAILGQTLEDRFGSKGEYARALGEEGKSEYAMEQDTLDNWREAALEKAADDVWTLNMLATFGPFKSDNAKAVREQALLRWQQAEPNNLVPLLHQQTRSADAFFVQAQRRNQFDDHSYPILRWMYQTLLQQRPHEAKGMTSVMIDIQVGTEIPMNKIPREVCRNNPPEPASLQWEQCQSIAQTLRQAASASSLVANSVGISVLKALATHDAEKQVLNEEDAYIRGLLKQRSKHMNGVVALKHYQHRLQNENINGELQEIEHFLLQEGLPLKPE